MNGDEKHKLLAQMRIDIGKIETKLEHDIRSSRREIKIRFKAISKALRIQAKEYARRLKDLNGEKDEIKAILAQCLPRTEFNVQLKELNSKIEALMQFKEHTQGGKSVGEKSVSVILSIIALLVAVASVVVIIIK